MPEAIAWLYVVLTGFSFFGFIIAVFGWMNDHNNRYPLPLLLAALVAGFIGQSLL